MSCSILGALALLLAGCVADPGEATHEVTQALLPEPGDDPGGGGGGGGGEGSLQCNSPHVVYFRTGGGAKHCSGVVIAPDLVLTAAHCMFEDPSLLSGMTVGVGGDNCSHGSSSIQHFKAHENWSSSQFNDVALVKLSSPLSGVSPVILTNPTLNSGVTVIGHGLLANGQRCTPGTISAITANAITINTGSQQLCSGDSGGGIFLTGTNQLVGVFTAGMPGSTADCDVGGMGGANWPWVLQTGSNMQGATSVGCTASTTKRCKLEGQACPSSGDACLWGVSTCNEFGVWGACAPNPASTWDPNQNRCVCNQTCAPGLHQDTSTCECVDTCNDTYCQSWESTATCPQDCPITCPNNVCSQIEQITGSCPQDCGGGSTPCGNGICDAGETSASCPSDCGPSSSCGDGHCDWTESSMSCPWDCGSNGYCGDGQCDPFTEDSFTCEWDCGGGSSCICGYDCPPNTPGCSGYCGDGQCDVITENSSSCPTDCSTGGGGGDPWDPCDDRDDPFWWYWFGDEAVDAYEYFCNFAW